VRQRSGARRLSGSRIIFSATLIACLLYVFVLDFVLVRGSSMEPGIKPGAVIVLLRCAYGLRPAWSGSYLLRWARPAIGDVVVLRGSAPDASGVVKRVFETGPSFLRAERGVLYGSAGSARLEPGSPLHLARSAYVAPDSVFVLGDNGPQSYDSRDYGSVPVENIRGKVLFLRRYRFAGGTP
jgi:signal peptidase I